MLLHALGFGIILRHGVTCCVIARHDALGVDATPDAVHYVVASDVSTDTGDHRLIV